MYSAQLWVQAERYADPIAKVLSLRYTKLVAKVMTYMHDIRHHCSNMLCIALSLHSKLCKVHAINSRLIQMISLAMRIQQEADHLFSGKDCSPGVCSAPPQCKLCKGVAMKACLGKAAVVGEQSTPQVSNPCQKRGGQPPADFSRQG